MVDIEDNRLEVAKRFGATVILNSNRVNVVDEILKLTNQKGVDTAIEAVGIPATFEVCEKIIAPLGTIANVGVHGIKVDLHLENLWDRNITITTRLVDTESTTMLLKLVQSKKIYAQQLITHRFKFDDALDAYKTFQEASITRALKVLIEV